MRIFYSFAAFLIISSLSGQGKLFNNSKNMALVFAGAEMIHTGDKDSARYYINQVKLVLPDHPIVSAMEAFVVLWENIPVLEGDEFEHFKSKLNETIDKAKKMDKDDPEAIFFEMASRGLLAEYYADRGFYMKALGEANQTYSLIKQGFELTDQYNEFLLMVGLYNYFRDAYPERHPIYKPFLWLFHEGDKELGLAQIEKATRESILSRVESHIYLTYIYLRYEENPTEALAVIGKLLKDYPNNLYVHTKYLESLAATRKIDLMPETSLVLLMKSSKPYYRMAGHIFQGMYHEFVNKNDQDASQNYLLGIKFGENLIYNGDHYKSLAFLGLGRVYSRQGDTALSNTYFKNALDISSTDEVEKEAKKALGK